MRLKPLIQFSRHGINTKKTIAHFDTFNAALLNGGKTEEGTIYATKDVHLREIAIKADQYHNEKFQPQFMRTQKLKEEIVATQNQLLTSMRKFEAAFNEMINGAEIFEKQTKERIKSQLAAGISADHIIQIENTWADMAMEIKTSLAVTRIRVEEYAQTFEAGSQKEIKAKYDNSLNEVNLWINALLNGAETKEGFIAKVDDGALVKQIAILKKTFDEEFQASARHFIELQDKTTALQSEMEKIETAIDQVGEEMIQLISGVEEGAKKLMQKSETDADITVAKATTRAWGGNGIGLILAIILGLFLTRGIIKPVRKVVELANRLSNGDLSYQLQVDRSDEIGQMGQTLKADELMSIFRLFAECDPASKRLT